MNSTESGNYYSAFKNQPPSVKQTSSSKVVDKVSTWTSCSQIPFTWFGQQTVARFDYEFPSGSYNDKESNNSDILGKNYSKIACNDYEAIEDPDEYGSAVHVYSNTITVGVSVNYDDTIMPEYSEVDDVDGTTVTDEEEIYSDPGHSEADIYVCFEKKKFRMIKRKDVRYIANYIHYHMARNNGCNKIAFKLHFKNVIDFNLTKWQHADLSDACAYAV